MQPGEMFGVITGRKMGSDLAALMKVERWFELLGEPEGRVRSLDEPEQWPRHLPQGGKCQVQKEIILLKKKKKKILLILQSEAHSEEMQTTLPLCDFG